ncbi:MAG: 50S ribosomal protein L9 [Actinobacteria bacterium]|jgi:large subunit ribosomal protein L9|nr:50S ribosomal protein L9 [Actinomycetota bacterium]MBT3745659.1 50S ribosomal protein L9 [Actinomycetota bacterium]MBT3969613.1 50S ribosomal protein L9 [Actinomycetota bacterium]MBT4009902.1 50S ribosomal protein L9 [Actinomycetota bacterium]MBT4303208.1 50S ribosomal protein L9 [Actinomycetota bacterium]
MKVLLRSDVEGLGTTGAIVDVARGYARNYLVPEGLAVPATAGMATQAEAMQRKRALKSAADRVGAETVAASLAGQTVTASAKASDTGHLFGSVGAVEIVAALASQIGVDVDRTQIAIETIKDVGTHEFTVQLHPEVAVPMNIEVTPEG